MTATKKEKRLTKLEEQVFGVWVKLPTLRRTIRVIEVLAGLYETKEQVPAWVMESFYKFSHMHSKSCKGVHMDFRHDFYKVEEMLKKQGELK